MKYHGRGHYWGNILIFVVFLISGGRYIYCLFFSVLLVYDCMEVRDKIVRILINCGRVNGSILRMRVDCVVYSEK